MSHQFLRWAVSGLLMACILCVAFTPGRAEDAFPPVEEEIFTRQDSFVAIPYDNVSRGLDEVMYGGMINNSYCVPIIRFVQDESDTGPFTDITIRVSVKTAPEDAIIFRVVVLNTSTWMEWDEADYCARNANLVFSSLWDANMNRTWVEITSVSTDVDINIGDFDTANLTIFLVPNYGTMENVSLSTVESDGPAPYLDAVEFATTIDPTDDSYLYITRSYFSNYGDQEFMTAGMIDGAYYASIMQYSFSVLDTVSTIYSIELRSTVNLIGNGSRSIKICLFYGTVWNESMITGANEPFSIASLWNNATHPHRIIELANNSLTFEANLTLEKSYRGKLTLVILGDPSVDLPITLHTKEKSQLSTPYIFYTYRNPYNDYQPTPDDDDDDDASPIDTTTIVIIVAIAGAGVGGFFLYQNYKKRKATKTSTIQEPECISGNFDDQGNCIINEPKPFIDQSYGSSDTSPESIF